MKKLKTVLVFIFLLCFLPGQAQPRTISWPAPGINDMKMQVYSEDTSATAVVLEKYADVYFDEWRDELRLIYQLRKRIKILKPEGVRYTTIQVPFISYDYFEDFMQVKGSIYHYSNGRIKKKRLKKKYITRRRVNNYQSILQIQFPDVQPGDIVDINYSFATFNFMQPPRFYFQEDIPVRYAEFNANIPFFMTYYFDVYRWDVMDKKTVEPSFANISWSARYTDPIPSGLYYHGYDFRVNPSFNFQSNYYHLVMKEVPAFFKEKFIDNPQNYYYHVDMKLQKLERDIGYSDPFAIFLWEKFSKRMYQTTYMGYRPLTRMHAESLPYPAGYFIFNATSWNTLAKDLRKDPAFGRQLKRFANVLPVITMLKNKHKDTLDLVKAIYKWVQDTIQWNGHYDFLTSQPLSKVLEKGRGNSADVNMLLVYSLRRAGIDANPVIIRTVDRGHLITDLAAFYQFNHVLASAMVGHRLILLDATGKHPWFVLPDKDMNQAGFLVGKDTSFLVPINHPVRPVKQYSITATVNTGMQLTGNMTYTITGLYTMDTTMISPAINPAIASLVPQSSSKATAAIVKKYTLVADSIISENDTVYILRPLRLFTDMKNIFDTYSRALPVYLGHTWTWQYNLSITLPGKIRPAQLPQIKKSINGMQLTMTTETQKKQVKITLTFSTDRYYFDVSEYQGLYDLMDLFQRLQNTKIILRKK